MTDDRTVRVLSLLVTAAAVVFGAWCVVDSFWVCDDAFISFRYAQNLLDGHGLVYNAEERVEGYTNFLWTVLVAAAMGTGSDPVAFGQLTGVGFFLGTVVLLLRASWRMAPANVAAIWPLAAIGLALHRHFQEYVSCGLETGMFTFLVTAMALALIEARSVRGYLLVGLLGTLLAMTRPDGAIFYPIAGLVAAGACLRQGSARPLVALALPGAVLFVPFFALKWAYYGLPFPNTFYAKSGGDPYPSQGLFYAALYFWTYWVLVPALLALPVLAWAGRSRWTDPGWRGGRPAAVLAGFVFAYLLFVVWVGGDFMFARFLIPISPLCYLALERAARRWLRPQWQATAAVAVGLATLLSWQHPVLQHGGPAGIWRGIGDERAQYPAERVAAIRGVGRKMGRALAGTETRVVFLGTQAMLVYDAGFHFALEGTTGLTDPKLARMELPARGRIGHEKNIHAHPGYMLERGVHFLLEPWATVLDPYPYRAINFFGMPATVVIYDRAIMDRLRGVSGVEFVDFEAWLDDYLASMGERSKAQVGADLRVFKLYYFNHNEDSERLLRLEEFLR